MTLIEMCIAIGVLAVLMLPLAGVFYTGQATDASNRQYGDAVALGDAALAKADAVTYSFLGFYEKQFGATCTGSTPTYNGQTGVDLGCNVPAGATPAIAPVDTSLQVGHIHYTLTTYIVWATGAGTCTSSGGTSGPCSSAYKQIYAVVSWNGRNGRTYSATQSILVYPGGLGTYSGGGQQTPSGTYPTPPNVTGLSVVGGSVTPSSMELQWNDPGAPEPGWYEIVQPNGSSQPTVNTVGTDDSWDPAGATVVGSVTAGSTFTVSGLNPSTAYSFVVIAFTPDGSQWAVSTNAAGATTGGAAPPPCTLTSLAIQQTGQTGANTMVVKNGNGSSAGHLLNAVSITVGYSGSCTGSNAVVVNATGPSTLGPYTLTYQSSPGQYVYNPPTGLCPASAFTTGLYTFKVTLDGASQTPQAAVQANSSGGSVSC